jgi:phosphatidylglycerophosphatase A
MNKTVKQTIAELLATGFYVGKLPYAPGTFGTLVAIPLILIYWNKGLMVQFSITMAVYLVGIWAATVIVGDTTGNTEKAHIDPDFVVIDEIAGYMVTMLAIEPTLIHLALGFVLFRIFDIFKPPPIKMFEKLPSGIGIMTDDIIAGVYAWIVLFAIVKFFNI